MMIDYKELSEDGVQFEQLARELLSLYGLSTHWTGQGQDQGRDLIAAETATGPLGSFSRRWLVSCKHFAHSGRAVGRADIVSLLDDCRQASANGFLLFCSTHPTTGLINKLAEISSDPRNRLVTAVWDSIEITKRLMRPHGFSLAHLFFPESMKAIPWQIYNLESLSKWAAHFRDYFLYLTCRDKAGFPELKHSEAIISTLETIGPLGEEQYIRPRAIYLDEKHYWFYVFADYLVPHDADRILSPGDFQKEIWDGQELELEDENLDEFDYPPSIFVDMWDIMLVKTLPHSDRYEIDDRTYYEPYLENFEIGFPRSDSISSLDDWPEQ